MNLENKVILEQAGLTMRSFSESEDVFSRKMCQGTFQNDSYWSNQKVLTNPRKGARMQKTNLPGTEENVLKPTG